MNLNHIQISLVSGAHSTITTPVALLVILQAIKQGRWREPVTRIRHRYNETLKKTGSHEKARQAVEHLKKNLQGMMVSGTFRNRQQPVKDKLITHSGSLCADMDVDALDGKDPKEIRATLQTSPYVEAVFLSPTGHGLKPIVLVSADKEKHEQSFRAVKQHILELTGVKIDESGKDLARLCFVSYDPDLYINPNAQEIEPLPLPEKPARRESNAAVNLNERQRITVELLGAIRWDSETHGFCTCPGKHLHTTGDAERDCEIHLDGAPTVHCFHNHCREILESINHELRSQIGKAECANTPPAREGKDEQPSYPWRNAEAAREFQAEIKSVDVAKREASTTRPRIAKLKKPEESVNLEQWRGVIGANFPALVRPAETCLSVVAQILLNDVSNPFALALEDVPSSSKTIILNFFDGPTELTYTTDNFTPASFVSHASNVKREELGNVDLLPRIRYHTLIVRELGSIFGANDDDLKKSLGILTRVLDGEGLETDSGVHGRRGYKGDYVFNLLAGTTPIQPRVFKIMGNFGSRLFFRRLHTADDDDDELIAQNKGPAWKLKESKCRKATENFLRTLWAENQEGVTWKKEDDPDDCLRVIARCARLLARLRGAINVWHSEGEGGEKLLHTAPVIEKPRRINCLFYNLARAHALICGRRQVTAEDLWPVLDVAFDTPPTIRAKVFRGLIEAGGTLCTSDVVKLLRCSPPTARKEMEALSVLGVVDKTPEDQDEPGRPETQINLATQFAWFGSDECKSLMARVTDIEGGNLFKMQSYHGIKKEFPPCVTVNDANKQVEPVIDEFGVARL